MPGKISLKAFAKVNLGLDVIRRREDGYHEVRMVMQSIRLFDRVHLEIDRSGLTSLTTNLSFLPVDKNNLVYRAIELIRQEFGIKDGIHAQLEKHIPVAAGLAGGSSDAAAALVGMNQLFSLGLSQNKLRRLGVTLGADIPFCIMRGTALSEGIGEILTPLPAIPDCYFLVVKPSFSMSTSFVYQHLDLSEVTHPDITGMIAAIRRGDLRGITSRMGNVLEQVTGTHFIEISEIRQRLLSLGAMNAIMSGSGSTVFGVFDREEPAYQAALILRNEKGIRMTSVVRPYNNPRAFHRHPFYS